MTMGLTTGISRGLWPTLRPGGAQEELGLDDAATAGLLVDLAFVPPAATAYILRAGTWTSEVEDIASGLRALPEDPPVNEVVCRLCLLEGEPGGEHVFLLDDGERGSATNTICEAVFWGVRGGFCVGLEVEAMEEPALRTLSVDGSELDVDKGDDRNDDDELDWPLPAARLEAAEDATVVDEPPAFGV
jgi:hypothetical protein